MSLRRCACSIPSACSPLEPITRRNNLNTALSGTFGIAERNFTAYPEMPNAKELVDYGVRVEQLGYDSVWVWDNMLLGVEPNFPVVDSLTVLTGIAAKTQRIKLGTGILVLPLRNPVVLAKQLSS